MKYLPLSLLLIPFLSFNSFADDKDFNISITAQGSIGPSRTFETIGSGKIYTADTLLQPHGGYQALLTRFEQDPQNRITTGVWQKAQAFNDFLIKCNINVPMESLVMKMGQDAIFSANSQEEIDQIASEVGQHLSFERKITFISQVGGALSGVYDYDRDSDGIVTMMDMVNARRNGGKAGVCRDMHQAMANIMAKMGVPDTFVVATQVVGGGHAIILAQDPNDPSKSYLVNYNSASSQSSTDPTAHLLFNGTIPSIGVSYRIYDSKGRPVATLPSGLGILLNDIAGKDPSVLDPYTRSTSSFARAELVSKDNFGVSLAAGESSDRDRVVALSAKYKTDDEYFPMEFNVSLYNMQRETSMRGKVSGYGAYIDGVQYIRYSPVKGAKIAGGEANVEVYGRVGMRSNFTIASEETGDKNAFSSSMDVHAASGTTVTFTAPKTNIVASVEAVGALDKGDVRDEGSMTFDLRHVTGSVVVSRELARGTDGYQVRGEVGAGATVRPGLGIQAHQEIGVRVYDDKGRSAALTVSHEGQVQGPQLAFVPGSLETYAIEASVSDRRRNTLGGGVFCTTYNDRKSCGSRVTGRLKF